TIMDVFDSLVGIVAVILIFGLPVIASVMGIAYAMQKDKHERDLRRMIIENNVDAEVAKTLIDKPNKKQPRRLGAIDVDTLRSACIMLGIGLGALINWLLKYFVGSVGTIYFWLIIAFGIGVGLLAAFIAEVHLYQKYGDKKPGENENKCETTKNEK
ncbi:MAG: hypothetical protein K6A36_07800, partial [Paludibacteraceae bacterium]|nr:hypothetical protein [Paludibacteraceae bacterium]